MLSHLTPQKPSSVLLSHRIAPAVPSALEGLTSVFGMGTGVAPPALPPGKNRRKRKHSICANFRAPSEILKLR